MARPSKGYTAQLVYMDRPEVRERVLALRDVVGRGSEAEVLRQIAAVGLPLLELVHLPISARVHGARGADGRERRIETYTEELRGQLVDQMRARHPRREPGTKRTKTGKVALEDKATGEPVEAEARIATVTPIKASRKRAKKAAPETVQPEFELGPIE